MKGLKMKTRIFVIALLTIILVGCAGSQMSTMKQTNPPAKNINVIAIAPGSGPFGDAIGVELFNLGFQIVDSNETAAIIGRAGLKEFEIYKPEGYSTFKERGIEAILTAKTVDVNGVPESASVRITNTTDGTILVGVTWQNGWGGKRGSIADRTMRKNLSAAAQDIAKELSKRLRIQ